MISVVDVAVVVKLLQLPTLYYKRVKIEVGYNIIYIEFLLCMHFGKMQGVINDLVSCRFSRWVKIIPDPPSLKLVALNADAIEANLSQSTSVSRIRFSYLATNHSH